MFCSDLILLSMLGAKAKFFMNKLKKYTFYYKIYMLVCVFVTKIFYPSSRLIRFPFDIRNSKNISLGTGFTCGHKCRLESLPEGLSKHDKTMTLGDNIEMNDFVHIAALEHVKIGDGVLIASKVFISDINHGCYDDGVEYDISLPPQKHKLSSKPVIIGDNVWLGESVNVLSGVTIGKGSIVGSQSVVSKDIPPYSIAVGIPARVIKKYNFETKTWEKI